MVATTDFDTTPRERDVARAASDTWAIAFAAELAEGESISSAAATLRQLAPAPQDDVAGFVTSATPSGTSVNVAWDGSALDVGGSYQLLTVATLNTGAEVVARTIVHCKA